MKPTKLSELINALEFDSEEQVNRVDLQNGCVVTVEESLLSALEEGNDEALHDLLDWQKEEIEIARRMLEDAGERFVPLPDKFDFHEYRQMERFIRTVENAEIAEQLWRAIKGKKRVSIFQGHCQPPWLTGAVVSVSGRCHEGVGYRVGRSTQRSIRN